VLLEHAGDRAGAFATVRGVAVRAVMLRVGCAA
jgi:hypothetical protein